MAAGRPPIAFRRADLAQAIRGLDRRPSEEEGFRPAPTQWPIPRQGAMIDGMPPVETMDIETAAYFRRYPDVARMYLSNNFGLEPNQFARLYHENFGSTSGLYAQEGRFWGSGEFTPETMGAAAYSAMQNRPLNLSDSYDRLATPADRMAYTANPGQFSVNMPRNADEFTSNRFRVPERVASASEYGVRRVTETTTPPAFTGALGQQTMSDATRAYFQANPDLVTEFNRNRFGLNADQYAAQHFALHGRAEGRVGTGLTSVVTAAPGAGAGPGSGPGAGAGAGAGPGAGAGAGAGPGAGTGARPVTSATTNRIDITGGPAALMSQNMSSATRAYLNRYPEVARAYTQFGNNMTADQFAATHYNRHGRSQGFVNTGIPGTQGAAPRPADGSAPAPAPPPAAPVAAPPPGGTLTSTITPSTQNPIRQNQSNNAATGAILGAGTQWLLNQLTGGRPTGAPPPANRPPAGAPPAANRPPAASPPPVARQAPIVAAVESSAPTSSTLREDEQGVIYDTAGLALPPPTPVPSPAPSPVPSPAPAPWTSGQDLLGGADLTPSPSPAPVGGPPILQGGLNQIVPTASPPPTQITAAPYISAGDLDLEDTTTTGGSVASQLTDEQERLMRLLSTESPTSAAQDFNTFGSDLQTTPVAAPPPAAEEPVVYTDGQGNYYDANGRFLYSVGGYDQQDLMQDYTASNMPTDIDYGDYIGGYDYSSGYDDVDYGGYFKDGGFVNLLYKDGGGVRKMSEGGWIDLGDGTSAFLRDDGNYDIYDNATGELFDTRLGNISELIGNPYADDEVDPGYAYVPGEEVVNPTEETSAPINRNPNFYRTEVQEGLFMEDNGDGTFSYFDNSGNFLYTEDSAGTRTAENIDGIVYDQNGNVIFQEQRQADPTINYGSDVYTGPTTGPSPEPSPSPSLRPVVNPPLGPAPAPTPNPNINRNNVGRVDMGDGTYGEAEEGGTFSVYDRNGRFLYTINSNNELVAAGNPRNNEIVRYNEDGTTTVETVDNYPGDDGGSTTRTQTDRTTGDQSNRGVLDTIRQALSGPNGMANAGILGGLIGSLLDRGGPSDPGGHNLGVDMAELSRMQQGTGTGVGIGQNRGPGGVYVPYEQYAYWNPQRQHQLYTDLGVSGFPEDIELNDAPPGFVDADGNYRGLRPDGRGGFIDEQGTPIGGEPMGPPEPISVAMPMPGTSSDFDFPSLPARDLSQPFGGGFAAGGATHYTYGTPVRPEDNLGMKRGGLSQAHTMHSHHTNPLVNGRIDFRHGSSVNGAGDGQSDDIPAMLADGEYVIDAETVAQLGNGSNKAGAEVLDKFRQAIRAHKRKAPLDKIPPKSKSALAYLKEAMNA